MAIIEPGKMRSVITESGGNLNIIIPANKRGIIVTPLFLFGPIILGWLLLKEFSHNAYLYEHSRLGGIEWPLMGICLFQTVFFLYFFLYFLSGKEIIIIDGQFLSVKNDILGFGRLKQYDLNQVKNLRVSIKNLGRGVTTCLAFDYGAKTFQFALGVDEAELKKILDSILRKYSGLSESRQ